MKIDYYNKPTESLESLLDKFNPNIFLIIDDVLSSRKAYRFVYQQILDMLKWAFEVEEVRKKPIRFKFHATDKEIITLQMNHFLSNLIIWYGFMEMDKTDVLDKSYIFDFTKFTMKKIVDYIDDVMLPLHEGDFYSQNAMVDEICYNITAISNAFCLLLGMSISIYDIIQAEKKCPEIGDIIFGTIDATMQPTEIEAELDRRTDRLIELFSQVDCDLKPLLVSGKNISKGQFKEMFIKIGFKSDINGRTIPLLIDDNIAITGLTTPANIYISATSGRKSLILTKKSMGEPGAFSKKINLLATSASYLRKDYDQCNSNNVITYLIRDEVYLRLLDKRYYYDQRGDMQLLDYQNDTHLIGKMVNFLSPCTCASEEGICKYCYGELYEINKDLFSVGSFAATKSSNPLGQLVLSSKHYQGTDSDTLTFNDDFDKVFDLSSSEISLKEDNDDDELFLLMNEVFIEESDDEEFFYVKAFKLIDAKGAVLYNISEDNDSSLYLSDQLQAIYKKQKDKSKPLSLDSFDSEESVLFVAEVKNKELTEPIKIIERALNRKDRGTNSLSDVCQLVADSFIEIGIAYNLVHFEALIRGLIRKKSNILEYPDWSRKGDPNDYQVLQVNSALFNNPSALVSITYGYVKKQLLSSELYEKTAPSHLDALFVRDLNKYLD